ncbi:hypothetical protein GDO86_004075, partial [Hymenochirus boettgeri]
MPTSEVLKPVLKMKVDELFLHWLSETPTQLLLKDYLRRIKNGENVLGECNEATPPRSIETSHKVLDSLSLSMITCSPPSPSPRGGLTPRSRRSTSGKAVHPKKEEPLNPTLSQNIPKFYFPKGCPKSNINIDAIIAKIEKIFAGFPLERATLEDMGKVAKVCDCPLYWKAPLFYAAGGDRTGYVSVHKFVAMWR